MNPSTHAETIPRGLLLALCALPVAALIGVAAVRLSGVSIHTPDAGIVAARSLRFEDRSDGSVSVIDGRSGLEVDRVQGEAGFLRGALRALARERRKRGLGGEAPFELLARADGRLTLADPATGERIDLESFGVTNAATFARLLTVNRATAPGPAAATR
jgi:putative photosynthetic complex assembly protein